MGRGHPARSAHGIAVWVTAGVFQRWSTRPPPGQIRSVAVLPLDDLSSDHKQEYFADGMTAQLIADPATIGGLRVISSTSVMHYRKSPKPA
jgi:TolB-like protein